MVETRYNTLKIGEKVKFLRERENLNQTQLASELGIKSATISSLESNKSSVSIDMLVKLCKYFNVTSDFILSLDEDKLDTTSEIIDININPDNYIYVEALSKTEVDSIKNIISVFEELKK